MIGGALGLYLATLVNAPRSKVSNRHSQNQETDHWLDPKLLHPQQVVAFE